MRVILEADVPSLGGIGKVVKVADGYANNYLLPRGLAKRATAGNLKQLELKRKQLEKREARLKAEMEAKAALINGKEIVIKVQVGEEDKLYGAVTAKDIVAAVKEQLKADVDKHQLQLSEHIKTTGTRVVKVRYHSQVEAELTVNIEAENAAE